MPTKIKNRNGGVLKDFQNLIAEVAENVVDDVYTYHGMHAYTHYH